MCSMKLFDSSFENIHILILSILLSASYFGIVITHFQVAIYTARRDEMVDVMQAALFYMNPDGPIPIHSPYSALPYQVLSVLLITLLFA